MHNECIIELLPQCSSVCLSVWDGMGMHCDHTVHFSTDLSLCWIVQCSAHPDAKACPIIFSSSTCKRDGVWMCRLGAMSEEQLNLEVKLLLSAKRKSVGTTTDDLQ